MPKALTISEKAIPPHSTSVNTREKWDGGAVMRATPNDANILKYMSGWLDESGDPNAKSSYKFPHHPGRMDAPANLNAVNNALARLSQSDIPAGDRAGVEKHLRKHRADAGLSESMTGSEISAALEWLIESGEVDQKDKVKAAKLLSEQEIEYVQLMPMNPTSFAELDMKREAQEKLMSAEKRVDDLWMLFWEIWRSPVFDLDTRFEKINALFVEFLEVVKNEINGISEEKRSNANIKESSEIKFTLLNEPISEDSGGESNRRKAVKVRFELARPGWGNSRQKRFYRSNVLRRDAPIFEGVKMYINGHDLQNRTVREEVGVIDKISGFLDDGTPLADATIFNPDLAEDVRNRNDEGKLYTLESSILANGTLEEKLIEGKAGFDVLSMDEGISVDLVPKGGAGGRARELLSESSEGDEMTEKTDLEKTPQTTPETTPESTEKKPEPQPETTPESTTTTPAPVSEAGTITGILSESDVSGYLEADETAQKLPESARNVLKAGSYPSTEKLAEAVNLQVESVRKLTNAGKPQTFTFLEPEEDNTAQNPLSEEEKQKRFDQVFSKHHI